VYERAITDEDAENLSMHFYNLPTTNLRRNQYIYLAGTNNLRIVNLLDLFSRTGFQASLTGFVYPSKLLDTCLQCLY
jgi:UDP-glucose:glycoprotein glucosyltransferase